MHPNSDAEHYYLYRQRYELSQNRFRDVDGFVKRRIVYQANRRFVAQPQLPTKHIEAQPTYNEPVSAAETTLVSKLTQFVAQLPSMVRPYISRIRNVDLKQLAKAAPQYLSFDRLGMHSLQSRILTSMAAVLVVVGAVVSFNSFHTNKKAIAQVKQITKAEAPTANTEDAADSDVPSEAPPPPPSVPYVVAADMPKYFTISSLGVHARVKPLGVKADGSLNTPSNIYDVGWYDASAKPGQRGTVVIDGHVSGPTQHGVFYNIHKMNAGDKVQIERGDGTLINYTVTGTQVYDATNVDMQKFVTSSVPGKNGLNFMTCTGRFNSHTNEFEQRVVVFTVQDD